MSWAVRYDIVEFIDFEKSLSQTLVIMIVALSVSCRLYRMTVAGVTCVPGRLYPRL